MYMASAEWSLISSGGSEVLYGTVAMLCDSSSGGGLIICARPQLNERTQSGLCLYCEGEEKCVILALERHSIHHWMQEFVTDFGEAATPKIRQEFLHPLLEQVVKSNNICIACI